MSRMLGEIFKKVQNLKSTVEEKRSELAARHVETELNGIKVVATCDKQIISIDIDPAIHGEQPDNEKLVGAILAAVNEALAVAGKIQKEEAKKVIGDMGLNLPGLF